MSSHCEGPDIPSLASRAPVASHSLAVERESRCGSRRHGRGVSGNVRSWSSGVARLSFRAVGEEHASRRGDMVGSRGAPLDVGLVIDDDGLDRDLGEGGRLDSQRGDDHCASRSGGDDCDSVDRTSDSCVVHHPTLNCGSL